VNNGLSADSAGISFGLSTFIAAFSFAILWFVSHRLVRCI
jgi:hypothetical protein